MATDGNLRKIFQDHIKDIHWQSVETFSTGRGVPDLNFCGWQRTGGVRPVEGWIELKSAKHWRLNHEFSPEQIAWIEQRIRFGGNVFIAVRRADKELWLFRGDACRDLNALPMHQIDAGVGGDLLYVTRGGPAKWNWDAVRWCIMKDEQWLANDKENVDGFNEATEKISRKTNPEGKEKAGKEKRNNSKESGLN